MQVLKSAFKRARPITILRRNMSSKESVSVEQWGEEGVNIYTLSNGTITAKISNYGGIITQLLVPDKQGKLADVVLGFDTLQQYKDDTPYFGCIVGRVANRIGKGKFTLEGRSYDLAVNNGPNHLHGGLKGFDKCVWDAEATLGVEGPTLGLSLVSPDGDQGYPGRVTTSATYTLTRSNELRLTMHAETDATTIINMCNHSYFNLAGHASGPILDHNLKMNASHYTPVDTDMIPTGAIASVKGTPLDFTATKSIGKDIAAMRELPHFNGGFDHNFVIDKKSSQLATAAEVSDPASGRAMTVLTDAPGVQLYTSQYLDKALGKGGQGYAPFQGFCLETQAFPDSVNKPTFPTVVLKPGETYSHTVVYKFSNLLASNI